MKKNFKLVILNLLFLIWLILAFDWDLIMDYVDKVTKEIGLKTPAYLLTILEKESSFTKNTGSNLGSKEANIKRCVNMCYYTSEKNGIDGKKLTKCYNSTKKELTLDLREQWCEIQYQTLEKIVIRLKLDINKVPFSSDFGIGYTQFQPTTWESYPELKNKNPWNLEDSIYAAAIKLLKDGIHNNERLAIGRYNGDPEYIKKFIESRQEWDGIISDTIFVFDCKESNFSCGLAKLKTEYDDCTENNWPIKRKKECVKNKVAQMKEVKIANLEKEKSNLVIKLTRLQTYNSTAVISAILFPRFQLKEELVIEKRNLQFLQNLPTTLDESTQKITYKEERIKEPQEQIVYKEERGIVQEKIGLNAKIRESLELMPTVINNIPTTENIQTTENILTTIEKESILNFDQEKEDKPKIIYFSGGSSPPPPKNPCDDYKNKNYPNILINEIQFETKTGSDSDSKDEFIELYNPNNEEVDLTCWSLEKYASKQNPTSTPTLTELIPSSKFIGKIKPYSFFLITSSSTKEKYQGDLAYPQSYSIAQNNVLILKKPNGEISDLVGYGNTPDKIFRSETSPFIASSTCFLGKTINRKNFQDTNNNSEDFWLRVFKPHNSLAISQKPREDFIDLSKITIPYFQVFSSSTEDRTYLILELQEPRINVSSTNYTYEILISTSTSSFSLDFCHGISSSTFFKLEDFGVTTTLPSPKFDFATATLSFEIEKCPSTSTTYYFALNLKDVLDEENRTPYYISSVTLPEEFCNVGEPITFTMSTSTFSTGKVLISEIRVIEGTSTGEYIELYNPNNFDIDLSGWRLERVNSAGKVETIVPSSKFKGVIPSFSYFLLINFNTSSELTFQPDIIYPKSYNLAKNNGLRLYDKDNNLIDKVFWSKVDNSKSFQRKKTAISNEISILNEEINLGNAYDKDRKDEDEILDFLLANPNPENSSVRKLTPKEIKDFRVNVDIQNKIYHFSWFSPAFYEQDIIYELSYSTSTDFIPIASTTFSLLDNQSLNLNLCQFLRDVPPDFDISFNLTLMKNDQIIEVASTSGKMINCKDINGSFEQIGDIQFDSQPFNPLYIADIKATWHYRLKNKVNLEKVTILISNFCGLMNCFDSRGLKVSIIDMTEGTSTPLFLGNLGQEVNLLTIAPKELEYRVHSLIEANISPPLLLNKDQEINLILESYTINRNIYPPKFEGEIIF